MFRVWQLVVVALAVSCVPGRAVAERAAVPTIAQAYAQVGDAVVRVEAVGGSVGPDGAYANAASQGSGVVISKDGLVLTASHLVQSARRVAVIFKDGTRSKAKILRSAPEADLALLKLPMTIDAAKVATLGDSGKMRVGDQIFVVGAPRGIDHTLSVGHISARRVPDFVVNGLYLGELLQTDAAINPGNSGGPMFNRNGEVIGIVSHNITVSGGYEGLGFAVSSNSVQEALLRRGAAWSGLDAVPVFDDVAAALNIPQAGGLLVQRVVPKSPIAELGLRGGFVRGEIAGQSIILGGDVILSVQGVDLVNLDAFAAARQKIDTLVAGDTVELRILRKGTRTTMKAVIPREGN